MARDPAPETPKMAHDSLVTVRLSEPDPIVLDSPIATSTIDTNQTTPTKDPVDDRPDTPISRKSSLLVVDKDDKDERDDSLDDESKILIKEDVVDTEALRSSSATMPPPILTTRSLQDELADDGYGDRTRRPIRKEKDDKVHDSIIEERIQRERPCRTLFIRNIKASTS